ncbi:MAG TPA: hypothetical protein VFD82_01695, partial [Planctomycetota bacterium]|nr:hypothetical protein [Planctomycetota bacterium]
MREEDDPIFGGKEPLPDDLVRLQKALSRLPLPPEPDWAAVQPARRRVPTAAFVYAYAAAAAALIVALSGTWLARDAWRVDAIAGAPSLRGLAFGGRVALMGSIATDDRSRARLEVRGLGRVDL